MRISTTECASYCAGKHAGFAFAVRATKALAWATDRHADASKDSNALCLHAAHFVIRYTMSSIGGYPGIVSLLLRARARTMALRLGLEHLLHALAPSMRVGPHHFKHEDRVLMASDVCLSTFTR
eukprot:6194356-Pleurochrysis_carterae.AAC.1